MSSLTKDFYPVTIIVHSLSYFFVCSKDFVIRIRDDSRFESFFGLMMYLYVRILNKPSWCDQVCSWLVTATS